MRLRLRMRLSMRLFSVISVITNIKQVLWLLWLSFKSFFHNLWCSCPTNRMNILIFVIIISSKIFILINLFQTIIFAWINGSLPNILLITTCHSNFTSLFTIDSQIHSNPKLYFKKKTKFDLVRLGFVHF
jgi:hypothetical protein